MSGPFCTILAGPNGSGKSSFFDALRPEGEFVNADDIARSLPGDPEDDTRHFQAGRFVIRRLRSLIASRSNFVFETTLSSQHGTRVMQQAKDAGFKVGLVYVTLDSPQRNIERVAFRVANGGHDIPRHTIVRRYEASFGNLIDALRIADEVVIADNSSVHPIVVFEIANAIVKTARVDDKNVLHERLKANVRDAYGLSF